MPKQFFIVGAQFDNKGAQSMLFITVDELRKRYKDCIIYCGCTEYIDQSVYNFFGIYFSDREKIITLGEKKAPVKFVEAFVKDSVKAMMGRYHNWGKYGKLKRVIKNTDLMIDISGYNIGDKWDLATHESYFYNIRLAQKFSIPMVLLPQSFGPFFYKKNAEYLRHEIKHLLSYPYLIYAREQQGYNLLHEELQLKQVVFSPDLVLQNKGINFNNVFRKEQHISMPQISKEHNVGIIPNSQCFKHGDKKVNMRLYKEIIQGLLRKEKEVYIFRHSREDLDICIEIKNMFIENQHVHLIKNDFTCIEYDAWIDNFEYIIVSRFHAAVHAYRNNIPCIMLGWAIKYIELAKQLGQSRYSFNLLDKEFEISKVIEVMDYLDIHIEEECRVIKKKIDAIQEKSCFSCLDELEQNNE